ncbi:MAG TPA: S41 family peptidase [Terracidiphilus sp.]|nr:S41 family peptidase [Terracidiphilus sp.]
MDSRARRALFAVIVFFAVCAFAGTVLQRQVGAQSSEDESQLRDSLKDFANVYSIVESNYAEPITGDKADTVIYDGAIPGMLRTLDPHSTFYDPKAYAAMRENQSGHYYGVGMVIQQQGNKVFVITPYENTPSYRAGIHPGDQIDEIDGKSAAGWTSDQVAKALKGPKGTHVQVTMIRDGAAKPLVFDLVRDEIPHPSIDLKYEIRPGVGYIHITEFMETTGEELADALKSFGPNLKGLVIDLRGNPGGLLSQAVDVCDQLLAKGQVIVSQRGRAYPDQVYTATHGNGGKDFPIVVLVNRNTASAAEIVSGALQDHDRALIVGQTTFGKGLVQTVYNLSQDTGLALTTYHYYTPSGRLIQRDYEGVSLYDYYYDHAGALPPNSTNREVKFTDSGRTVYGGGGITPDDKIDMPDLTDFQEELLYAKSAFLHFAPLYVSEHPETKNFQATDAVMTEFEKYLTSQGIDWNADEIAKNRDWLASHIEQEVDTIWFGNQDGLRVAAEEDPVLQKAVTYLPQAEALEINAQKVMAAKAEARNQGAQGVPAQP